MQSTKTESRFVHYLYIDYTKINAHQEFYNIQNIHSRTFKSYCCPMQLSESRNVYEIIIVINNYTWFLNIFFNFH